MVLLWRRYLLESPHSIFEDDARLVRISLHRPFEEDRNGQVIALELLQRPHSLEAATEGSGDKKNKNRFSPLESVSMAELFSHRVSLDGLEEAPFLGCFPC